MRKLVHLISLVLIISGAAYGQAYIPQVSTDTLWLDSIVTHSGQEAVLDIYFANADTINAIDVPLTYQYPDLIIDSISFAGSRVEDRFVTVVEIDSTEAVCHIGAFYFDIQKEEVGPGRGLFARIHMTIPEEYPTRLITFDTTFIQTGLTFASEDDSSYIPIFHKGYVDNSYTPSLPDSVWVEDVNVIPGQRFKIGVFNYNQQPVTIIKLPLEYPSDNLIFDSVSVAGTRSEHATVYDALINNIDQKGLVSLRYDDADPLANGTGRLVDLHFTCQVTGTTASVEIDTTVVDYGDYYFQLCNLFGCVKVYPDFKPGMVFIDLSTDTDLDENRSLPTTYNLEQNHPNPFNPVTTIAFTLPERCQVNLRLFNILGQEVRRLIDQVLPAGEHKIVFDGLDRHGNQLATGVYLYRIDTEAFSKSRKMILMK